MRKANGLPQGTATFAVLPLGGGGFSTGGAFALDGTYVHSEDVYGAYIKGPTDVVHRQLFTAASLPAGEFGPSKPNSYPTYVDEADGSYTVTIAPSNSSVIYGAWNGYWFRSADGGATFTKLGGPYVMKANTGAHRLWGSKSTVDPQNPNVAMLGVQEGKIIYTTDGSTLNVLTVAAGTVGYPHLVAVDPSSSVVSSIKQKWAYTVPSVGIYQSTTGPSGPYSLLTGSPVNPGALFYDAAGNLWTLSVGESTNGNIYKKTPAGSFAKITSAIAEWQSIAVDPSNTNSIVVMDGNGYGTCSIDGAATWVSTEWFTTYPAPYGISTFSTAVKWFGKQRGHTFFPSQLLFHPTNGRVYAFNGVGVYWSVPPTTFVEWLWYEDTAGEESLEIDWILKPPGSPAIVCARDEGFFRIDSETRWLNLQHFPNPTATQAAAWHADYVPGNPTHIVGCCSFVSNCHGYSRDGGNSWTQFSGNHPAGIVVLGGCIVAENDNKLVWVPANNIGAAQSSDNGATWSYISGFPNGGGETGFGFSLWNYGRHACSDKITGDIYLWNYGPTGNTGLKGIWRRAAGTSTFVQQCTVSPPLDGGGAGFHPRLRVVPGQSSDLFFKGDGNTPLSRSTDYGATWTAVANTGNVRDFCFGKPAPGKTYPTIFFCGVLSGVYGIYRSDDNCTTWVLIATYPNNYVGGINSLEGDPDTYGKLYIATDHNGALVGYYRDRVTLA